MRRFPWHHHHRHGHFTASDMPGAAALLGAICVVYLLRGIARHPQRYDLARLSRWSATLGLLAGVGVARGDHTLQWSVRLAVSAFWPFWTGDSAGGWTQGLSAIAACAVSTGLWFAALVAWHSFWAER